MKSFTLNARRGNDLRRAEIPLCNVCGNVATLVRMVSLWDVCRECRSPSIEYTLVGSYSFRRWPREAIKSRIFVSINSHFVNVIITSGKRRSDVCYSDCTGTIYTKEKKIIIFNFFHNLCPSAWNKIRLRFYLLRLSIQL